MFSPKNSNTPIRPTVNAFPKEDTKLIKKEGILKNLMVGEGKNANLVIAKILVV